MKTIILIFLFVVSFLSQSLGNDFFIAGNNKESLLSKNMSFKIVSEQELIKPHDIINGTNMKQITNPNFGMQFGKFVWTKVSIANNSSVAKTIFIYNPRPGIDFIDVFIYKEKSLVRQYLLGDSRPLQNREIISRFSTIKLELLPNEKIEIISKLSNPHGRIDAEWILMDENSYYKFLIFDQMLWGLILGGILFVLLFQFFFYSALRNKYFIHYMFFSLVTFGYLLSYNGFSYLLLDGGIINNLLPHIFGYSILLLYVIFLDNFLDLRNTTKSNKILLNVIYGLLIFLSSTSWVIAFSPVIYQFDNIYFILHLLIVILLIVMTSKEMVRNKDISYFYLLGQLSLLLGYLSFALNGFQIIQTKSYSQQILGISVIFEMFFFSYAISQRITAMKKDKIKNEKLILSQAHFSSIGQTLRNIAHQWKIPMVRFGTLITELETTLIIKRSYDERTEKVIDLMRNNLYFMTATIEDFRSFYTKNDQYKDFSPQEAIDDVKLLLLEKINHLNGEVIFSSDMSDLKIHSSSRSFTHVAMILLDNALDAAEEREIAKPCIKIYHEIENGFLKLHFEDNCAGISQVPLSSIFELNITSHADAETRGNGLSIAKMLVEEKMNGKITATNTQDGAKFSIILPHKQS